MPPNPPSKAHGFDMQISNSEKKFLHPPPLPNPGYAPEPTANLMSGWPIIHANIGAYKGRQK